MKDKKIIMLVVLGIAAIISLLYGLTSSPRPRRAPITPQDISQPPKNMPSAVVSIKRRAARTRFKSWKRSPFVAVSAPSHATLVLNGITGGKTPKAMIGDALVGIGDKIANSTVVAIKNDRVVLNDGSKDFELVMKQ